MTLHACTIATPDHLARARVLARSLREQHPDARCSVLMVGGVPAGGEPFEVLAPERLGVPCRTRRCCATRASTSASGTCPTGR
jgi:hypothetical protein